MGIIISFIVFLLVFWALLLKKHRVLIFLSIISIFADNFRLNIGPSLLLVNCIGFLLIPFLVQKIGFFGYRAVRSVFRPLWFEYFYLVLLGLVFGFLVPWEDTSSHRMWTQQAGGRTIITLLRLFNELILGYYIVWAIFSGKVPLRFVISSIAYATLISFVVGFVDYFIGYRIKTSLFYMVPELADRFLGLNGEPKMYGRNSALAYAIILLYYLRVEKSNRLVFFIIVNILGVILSLSASTIILFAFLSIYILFISGKIKGVLVILAVTPIAYFILSSSTFFVEVTKSKIEKALLGVNNEIIPGEPKFFTRFDVFDRLALVYLYENPQYIITGVGPNLISLPASQYVNSLPEYTTFAERGGIDSVPNVMVNNVLARSGLIGVLMYIFFFKRLYRLSLRDKTGFSKGLVVISIAFNMVYFSVVLCFITGIVVAINIRRHINLRDT